MGRDFREFSYLTALSKSRDLRSGIVETTSLDIQYYYSVKYPTFLIVIFGLTSTRWDLMKPLISPGPGRAIRGGPLANNQGTPKNRGFDFLPDDRKRSDAKKLVAGHRRFSIITVQFP